MHPVLFHIGSLPVRAYGTLVIIGFLLAVWRSMRVCASRMQTEPEGSPRRIAPDTIFDFALVGLIAGIAGARLVYVLLDWPTFQQNPVAALKFWEGGLSLHGAMLGAILCLFIYCRLKRISAWALADLGAVAWPLAYAFGRIGCLLNGCCYGSVCDLPWGVRFPDERFPGQNVLTPPSHPIQLYAALINLGFFYILTRWEKRPHRDGELFFGYLAMYGAYRGLMEIFRAGATSTYLLPGLHLTETHLISALMVLIGLGGIAWLRRQPMLSAPSRAS
jgi:phosphatidylglycerol:prolipoprotein diacylglycerol transferase